MQVSPRRADVITALRAKAAPLENHLSSPPTAAAYHSLQGQADYLESTPGETLAEGKEILQAQRASLKEQRNQRWIAGGLLFAAGAACCFGDHPALTVGRLVGLFGGAATFVWGGMTDDKVRASQRMIDNLSYWETAYPKLDTAAPAGGGTLLKSSLELAASQNMKSELLQVMDATEGYLASQPQEAEVQAALGQVQHDRRLVVANAGDSLEEMRQLARQDTARANKLRNYLTVGALATFAAGGACIALGAPNWAVAIGSFGGAALAIRGGLYGDHEGRNNRLIGTVDRWEMQLDGLKNIARSGQEVRQLAEGMAGQTAGVEERDGHVVLGGIRVPVRVKSNADLS